MKIRLLILILALALVGVLALVFRDFVRDAVVTPIAYGLWVAGQVINSLPQGMLWLGLLVVVLVIAAGSLLVTPKPVRRGWDFNAERRGPVEALARRVDLAARGTYFRWHLSRRLKDLAVDAVAYQQRTPTEQVAQQLETGALDLPPAIRAYLLADLTPEPSAFRFGRRAPSRAAETALDLDPAAVIQFLEDQVEVHRDLPDH